MEILAEDRRIVDMKLKQNCKENVHRVITIKSVNKQYYTSAVPGPSSSIIVSVLIPPSSNESIL